MAFLTPLIGPAVKGATALGSSLLGSKLAKANPTQPEQKVLGQDAQAQQLGLDTANSTIPNAQNLIGMGSAAYQPVLNYWSSILSGNRNAVTSAMGPEISRIGQGYNAAANTSAALNPRGGPSTSFLSELPFTQQRDVTSLLQQARPTAATNLFNTGQGITQTGSNLLNTAINSIYGSTAAGRDILNSSENMRKLEAERGKAIGSGLFDVISKYGSPAIDEILKKANIGNKPKLDNGPGYPTGDYTGSGPGR